MNPEKNTDCNSNMRVIETVEACLGEVEGLQAAYSREYPAVNLPCLSASDLPLRDEVKSYLTKTYPNGLFSHQHTALQQILGHHNVVVATRTSSGKSLIFTIPVFNDFIQNRFSTSLFIYPQKALANDQLLKLREISGSISSENSNEFLIARYDGATLEKVRPQIRDSCQFVLTNPDMLHYAILQYHDKWARFFSRLQYVIIDEAHAYRGVFGTNVAYILRRLRCVCQHYHSDPIFISASATIQHPREHLDFLTGLEFLEIGPDQDGSIQGKKKLWLLRSKMHYYQLARVLTRLLVDHNLNCLTFCPSRVSAERLIADISSGDTANGRIRVYRAGLKADEREEIEAGMKTGHIKGVFSTSALELGIDIGALDVTVCVGLPNTMMSLWQRAGRVGRAGKEGCIIFIAADTPLDSYFLEHPEELFERENEPLAVNLQNRRIVCNHFACAIQEAGDEEFVNTQILGAHIEHALQLRRIGRLSAEVFYSDDPHMRTPVRSSEAQNYRLMVGEAQIGEIDPWHLIREAYPHGIYLHGGRPYRVADIFKSSREVRLVPEHSRNLTDPHINKAVYTRHVRAVTKYPHLIIKMADFEVTERLVAVLEKTRNGDIVKQFTGSQGLAPHRLPTEGISIEVDSELCRRIEVAIRTSNRSSVVHAIERLIRGLFPVISGPCDIMDFNTFSEARSGMISWCLYDQVRDGIDLTIGAYERVADLLAKALDRVASCKCEDDTGCFRCIRNPEEEEVSSKTDCVKVLSMLCQELMPEPSKEAFDVDLLEEDQPFDKCPNPKCGAKVRYDDKFCSNCGERLGG